MTTNDAANNRVIAIHEAGHAVAASLLGLGIRFVTVIASDDALGITEIDSPLVSDWWDPLAWEEVAEDGESLWRDYIEKRIMEKLAGTIAVEILLPRADPQSSHDDYEAVDRFAGFLTEGSIREYVEPLENRIRNRLEEPLYRDAVDAVANALQSSGGKLTGDQAIELVPGGAAAIADWKERVAGGR